jgi:hypothetical protein
MFTVRPDSPDVEQSEEKTMATDGRTMRRRTETIATSEPIPIEDVFVSNLTTIENHGGWLRAEFAVERETTYGPVAVVVARLTMTRETLASVVEGMIDAAGAASLDITGRTLLS